MAETRRQAILARLKDLPQTTAELSQALGMSERQVSDELEHVRRTAGKAFVVTPARCLACEFVFAKRERLSAPSRCPQCRSERIEPPSFRIV
jgi:predicted Zn-ribbon and HTH transcriptional regulator